jgi:hypothetical protein
VSVPCGLGVIGSLVRWCDVPSGSMVRGESSGSWYVRVGDCGWCVYAPSDVPPIWCAYAHYPSGTREDEGWAWGAGFSLSTSMRVGALGLKGDESAEALKDFADAFERRFPWEGP